MISWRVLVSLVGGGYAVPALRRSKCGSYYMKLLLLIISFITFFIPWKPYPYLISIINLGLIWFKGNRRFLILIAANCLILITLLSIASIIMSYPLSNAINYTLYVLTWLSAIIYVALTSNAEDIEACFRVEGIARFTSITKSLSNEIRYVYETFLARGFELGFNFMRALPPLTAIIVNVIDRIVILEESLKARGYLE